MSEGVETSGGALGMNGAQRRLAWMLGGGFLLILAAIMTANALSSISDLRAAGVDIRPDLVWSWEWSSMIGWISVMPLIWFAVRGVRPPRVSWPLVVLVFLLGSVIVSAWHIGVMVGVRALYYPLVGAGDYHFEGAIEQPLLYEFRKDLAAYLQFVALAVLAQWLIDRAGMRVVVPPPAEPEPEPVEPRMLAIVDGSITYQVPAHEIEHVSAAGNYVEIAWGDQMLRTLLHRTTLTALGDELGQGFVRIHRGRLVRCSAVREIRADKSGDFFVTLASGTRVRGSRRYRAALEEALAMRA